MMPSPTVLASIARWYSWRVRKMRVGTQYSHWARLPVPRGVIFLVRRYNSVVYDAATSQPDYLQEGHYQDC